MADWDKFRISIEADQTLRMAGSDGFLEPICPVCNTPIAWVLDMMSFKHDNGTFVACHARCVWEPEAFNRVHHRGRPNRPKWETAESPTPWQLWRRQVQAERDAFSAAKREARREQ